MPIEDFKRYQQIEPSFERLILDCLTKESDTKLFVMQEGILYKRIIITYDTHKHYRNYYLSLS